MVSYDLNYFGELKDYFAKSLKVKPKVHKELIINKISQKCFKIISERNRLHRAWVLNKSGRNVL